MIHIWYAVIFYFIVINPLGLCLMGLDNSKARCHAWRISEKSLFLVSILGGSLGTWAGMYLFRHKTKHWYFVLGMPFIFILQAGLFIYLTGKI